MSPQPALVPFRKPWRSHSDLVAQLRERGLVVVDEPAAAAFLAHMSYYRFSGYCLAFEVKRHQFVAGATFDQVVAAYQFDLALRDLVTEALEVVEVDLRATVAHLFGETHGAFGHTDQATFFRGFRHDEWIDRLRDEAERSREVFVMHFRQTYQEFPDLPIWIATEVMSFGGLSTMYAGMVKKDKWRISQRYAVQMDVLANWMHHLVYVRNLCAHHARLWDHAWTIKPVLLKAWLQSPQPSNSRLFVTLLILRHLMTHIPAIGQFASQWHARVTRHLATPPAVSRWRDLMGLTADWSDHPAWQ